jgi:hypothetical protein
VAIGESDRMTLKFVKPRGSQRSRASRASRKATA